MDPERTIYKMSNKSGINIQPFSLLPLCFLILIRPVLCFTNGSFAKAALVLFSFWATKHICQLELLATQGCSTEIIVQIEMGQ